MEEIDDAACLPTDASAERLTRRNPEDALQSAPFDWLEESLEPLRAANLLRSPRCREIPPDRDFSSNDYLGIRRSAELWEGMKSGDSSMAFGAGSSPAVSGWSKAYDELIREIADWKRAEAALVFTSGYIANLSVVASLVSAGDVVYADRLAHACLIDGARLSGALLRVFPHNDPDRLERIMRRDHGRFRRRLIVTESLFSMDGDAAPLQPLADLATANHSMMLVDEAHATGLFGVEGQGLVEQAGLSAHPAIVRMGTLSKAVGCQGGFVVGSEALISWMIQSARGWIYSTALSPRLAEVTVRSIRIIRQAGDLRNRVSELSDYARRRLGERGWQVTPGIGPIVPVVIGGAAEVLEIGKRLESVGLYVGIIRPPTVPRGTARLRISISATHRERDIDRIVEAMGVAIPMQSH